MSQTLDFFFPFQKHFTVTSVFPWTFQNCRFYNFWVVSLQIYKIFCLSFYIFLGGQPTNLQDFLPFSLHLQFYLTRILSVVDSTAFCYLDLQIYHNFYSLAYNWQLLYCEKQPNLKPIIYEPLPTWETIFVATILPIWGTQTRRL